jgi:hypothetical protein
MKLAKLIALILLIMVAFAGGCRKNQTVNAPAPVSPAAAVSPPEAPHPLATASTVQMKYFRGSVGSSNGLHMKLIRDGDKLTGTYFYQKVGTKIDLKGTVDKDGNVTLDEFDAGGKQTGSFKGLWQTDSEDGQASIAGNWSKPNGEKKTAFSIHQEPIEFTGSAELVARQIRETNKKLNYKIEVGYPEVTAPLDNRFDKFNQEAKNLVVRVVADFKKERTEAAKDEAQQPEPSTLSDLTSDLSGGYTVAIATDSLISIEYDLGGYTAGAAHGNSRSLVLNYDVKAGKVLKLADMFNPRSKYLQAISAYCINDLRKQSRKNGDFLAEDMIKTGAAPEAGNFQSWRITKQGLGFTFDAYRVGPYAAGPQTVLVPYSALKVLIKPDGPIGPLSAFANRSRGD